MAKKKANIAGLQLADLMAYPLARRAIGNADERTMAILMPKLYRGDNDNIEFHGAKVFPPPAK